MEDKKKSISEYLKDIDKIYKDGEATEQSYRPILYNLFNILLKDFIVINEVEKKDYGIPDIIVRNDNLLIGFIEAKKIGVDLKNNKHNKQIQKYSEALENIIFTDHLNFIYYRDNKIINEINIGQVKEKRIVGIKENFETFLELINQFIEYKGLKIDSSEALAINMANKAKLLYGIVKNIINNEETNNNIIEKYFEVFKENLIYDLTKEKFADIYVQTIVYGLFAARMYTNNDNFTRYSAGDLIPQSNIFLRMFFHHLLGDLNNEILNIIELLVNVLRDTDIEKIKIKFFDKNEDPYIYFYETFLKEYDKVVKRERGVYYTPPIIVKFIVNSVDKILKNDFNLKMGLADDNMVEKVTTLKNEAKITKKFHKVQILDPATGTGTFLSSIIDKIFEYYKKDIGIWNSYCENNLTKRIYAFEYLMASYTIAHLRISMKLKETGYLNDNRLGIYLTNTLEEPKETVKDLPFAEWLSEEAKEASIIKNDLPVMVILGNPPYNNKSKNKGNWIENLVNEYKYINGVFFNEKKHHLKDDYVKFIRCGQNYIEKNGEGILAYINNHGFLDNPTFNGMRWNLLKAFDKIYVIDLHGSTKKREEDENVFDIETGVSINIFIKNNGNKNKFADVFYYSLYGTKEDKFKFLNNKSIYDISFEKINPIEPYFLFIPQNKLKKDNLNLGVNIKEIFDVNGLGFQTANDDLLIGYNENYLKERIRNKQNIEIENNYIKEILYRPFDNRYVFYVDNKSHIESKYKPILPKTYRSQYDVIMKHFINKNYGLIIGRQGKAVGGMSWNLAFVTNKITDLNVFYRGGGTLLPIYSYDEISIYDEYKLISNIKAPFIEQISNITKLSYMVNNPKEDKNVFTNLDIIDYIYAILYSNKYREKYNENLKIEFPFIPYPTNLNQFNELVLLGAKLRELHIMENIVSSNDYANFPKTGTGIIEMYQFQDRKIWINREQYFDNISEEIWSYFIGGYQPSQKWLKDRKGKKLEYDDIKHYKQIIYVLSETINIQSHIDKLITFKE